MRAINLFTASVAATLLLGAVAHASDAASVGEGSVSRSEVFKGPSLPWNLETFQPVSVAGAQHYPELNWTAAIGTGTAASLESGVETSQRVSPAAAQHHPQPDWTSTIGTGTAAGRDGGMGTTAAGL
jgi:hypothetical protein